MIFKGSVCSTSEIPNKHKDYTEEFHEAEEKAITAIEEDHNIEPGLELKMLIVQQKHNAEVSSQKKSQTL